MVGCVDVNSKGINGETVLHVADNHGSLGVMKWLDEARNAALNSKDGYRLTVMHFAAMITNLAVMRWWRLGQSRCQYKGHLYKEGVACYNPRGNLRVH